MTAFEASSKAIVQAWYAGLEGGNALANILFGKVNPSGKLPMTFPKKLQDSPAHALGEYPGRDGVVRYKEGLMVGYRYFDKQKVDPMYPFGFGLSYTTFAFENLKADKGEKTVKVTMTVKNTGSVAGAEVVQVYVKDNASSVFRPEKELKGFKKVSLAPGEAKEISFELDETAFQFYDDAQHKWVLEPGVFTIMAGNSSKNVPLNAEVTF
jgi:beta-glucosidase